MASFKLGMYAKLYFGPNGTELDSVEDQTGATAALATMTELGNVKDLTLNCETGESDITTRSNKGWEATAATLKKCTVDFEMVYKPDGGDVGFTAIRNAWLNSTEIPLAPLTDAHDTTGAEGPIGNYTITNFSRKESLTEAITVAVTAKMANFKHYSVTA